MLVMGDLGTDFGFVTITNVELTDDLRNAKIYLSIMGSDEEVEQHFGDLLDSKGKIRKLLAQRIPLRYTPTIKLYKDESLDNAIRVQEILNRIQEK